MLHEIENTNIYRDVVTANRVTKEITDYGSNAFKNQQHDLPTVDELVAKKCPTHPLYCIRPMVISSKCRQFISKFNGDVLYSFKCNSDPFVLDAVWEGGVRHFDCASLKEIELVRTRCPSAIIHYLHPIKSKADITEAYIRWKVRTFVLDSTEELEKITLATINNQTKESEDITLIVRLALPDVYHHQNALYPLSGKFGVEGVEEAATLLKLARSQTKCLGLCFHVGSQCANPESFTRALAHMGNVIECAGVPVEIIDVGGGFPVHYPHSKPPDLDSYMRAIELGFTLLPSEFTSNAKMWCEPGRALVAEGCSLVIRVEFRRPHRNIIHVNDGTYGNMRITGPNIRWRFPVRLLRSSTAELIPFTLYGPTCDCIDYMPGPFLLPSDVDCGDYIEIGQFGAYNKETSTSFNGFNETSVAMVRDLPMPLASVDDSSEEYQTHEKES